MSLECGGKTLILFQRTKEIADPLILVGGDEDNSSLAEWQGMKPSECWIKNGISMLKGKIYKLNYNLNMGFYCLLSLGVHHFIL